MKYSQEDIKQNRLRLIRWLADEERQEETMTSYDCDIMLALCQNSLVKNIGPEELSEAYGWSTDLNTAICVLAYNMSLTFFQLSKILRVIWELDDYALYK